MGSDISASAFYLLLPYYYYEYICMIICGKWIVTTQSEGRTYNLLKHLVYLLLPGQTVLC